MSAIANCLMGTGTVPLLYRWARWVFTSGLAIFASFSHAVTFEVTTAEEFQAALGASASNGADDEIRLSPGIFLGNFKYVPEENNKLVIRGSGKEETTLDGNNRAFVFFMSAKSQQPLLILENMSLKNYSNAEGAIFRMTSDQDWPFGWSESAAPRVEINNVDVISPNSGIAIFPDGGDLQLSGSRITGGIVCNYCGLAILDSSIESPQHSISVGTLDIIGSKLMLESVESSNFKSGREPRRTFVHDSRLELSSLNGQSGRFDIRRSILAGRVDLRGDDSEINYFSDNEFYGECDDSPCYAGVSLTGRGQSRIDAVNNLVSGSPGVELSINSYVEFNLFSNTILAQLTLRPLPNGAKHQLINNIVWLDSSEEAIGVIGFAESAVLKNNILSAESSSIWDESVNNFFSNPAFADLDNGDYHLSSESIGINSGSNETVNDEGSTDLDGNPRILDGTIDIGAYERNTAPLHPADTNGDGSISSDEFNAYNAAWRANDIWPTAPAVITADFVTRAGYLLQKGGDYKNIGVGKPQTWVPINE